jgi:hypothetical protein
MLLTHTAMDDTPSARLHELRAAIAGGRYVIDHHALAGVLLSRPELQLVAPTGGARTPPPAR